MAITPATAITIIKLIKEAPGTYDAIKEFIAELKGKDAAELERVLKELEREQKIWSARVEQANRST